MLRESARIFLFIICTGHLLSCDSEVKDVYVTENFCDQIHLNSTEHTLSKQLEPLKQLMSNQTGVYVLEQGDESMVARAWLSENAEKSIDVQYFIFSADNVGLIACDYLLRAADRGVRVRILVDDIMVDSDIEELLALDAHPNLTIKIYNPTANFGKNIFDKLKQLSTDFRGFNQRMHNKTFVVDHKVVITGGRNIADEYFDYDHRYNFRDRDVLLLGKTSTSMQSSFNQFWEDTLSVDLPHIVSIEKFELNIEEQYNYLHNYSCDSTNFWPQVREKIKNVPNAFQHIQNSGDLVWTDSIYFVSDIPGKNDGSKGLEGGGVCTNELIKLINEAKESISIQSPYLITTKVGQKLFKKAMDRGVEVKILTNSLASTDNIEAFNGYQRDREQLLKTGVKIYEFKPDASIRYKVMTGALQKEMDYTPIFGLHAKSMVIDKKTAVIGTFNLDPRSANLNTECITVIQSKKIANELYQTMEVEFQPENAWETTLQFNPDSVAGAWKQLNMKLRRVIPKSIL